MRKEVYPKLMLKVKLPCTLIKCDQVEEGFIAEKWFVKENKLTHIATIKFTDFNLEFLQGNIDKESIAGHFEHLKQSAFGSEYVEARQKHMRSKKSEENLLSF